MSDNVIKFPAPETKINLGSPEVRELTDKIAALTQCSNLIVLQKDEHLEGFHIIRIGDMKLSDILLMYCHGIYSAINKAQKMEEEDDHI